MKDVDLLSFQLGMINCFAEMVAVGVKRLAVSPPLTPEEYEDVREASEAIVEGSGIRSYLEKSLLITDLQSADFTRGKWSVLYFRDEATLEAYLRLKEERAALDAGDMPDGEAGEIRRDISRRFMQLLSYPASVIEEKLQGGGESDPFILPLD